MEGEKVGQGKKGELYSEDTHKDTDNKDIDIKEYTSYLLRKWTFTSDQHFKILKSIFLVRAVPLDFVSQHFSLLPVKYIVQYFV